MEDHELLRKACETVAGYLALGNESFVAHGATFVRNRSAPSRYDANHIGLIRASTADEIEALLSRADLEFGHLHYRRFDIDPLTPPAVEARLALDGGYSSSEGLHLLLEGELQAQPKPFEIREVISEDDWRQYERLAYLNWLGYRQSIGRPMPTDDETREWSHEYMAYKRAKAPVERTWLACVDAAPCSFFSSWPGENGIGQVEDLFTHADYRRRGLATALVAHCVADARDRGAGPVVISANPYDTPKQMYAAMGFRPLFVSRSYIKTLEAAG